MQVSGIAIHQIGNRLCGRDTAAPLLYFQRRITDVRPATATRQSDHVHFVIARFPEILLVACVLSIQ